MATEDEKQRKETENNDKLVGLNPKVSTILLNVSNLNTSIKGPLGRVHNTANCAWTAGSSLQGEQRRGLKDAGVAALPSDSTSF